MVAESSKASDESSTVEDAAAHVDGVVFRRAGLADADALSLVAGATFLESFAGILPLDAILGHNGRHNSPAKFRSYLSAPRTQAWLACAAEGGAPVGYAMLTEPDLPLPDLAPEDIELRRIYLFSRFQGDGTGQALMDLAVAGARQSGAPRLLLGVYGKNYRALRFYERNGFRVAGTRQFTVGTLVCDDLVLARSL